MIFDHTAEEEAELAALADNNSASSSSSEHEEEDVRQDIIKFKKRQQRRKASLVKKAQRAQAKKEKAVKENQYKQYFRKSKYDAFNGFVENRGLPEDRREKDKQEFGLLCFDDEQELTESESPQNPKTPNLWKFKIQNNCF